MASCVDAGFLCQRTSPPAFGYRYSVCHESYCSGSAYTPCTGGKPAAVPEAEDGSVGKKGKQKVSRKERIQRKRDQKRAERQAGSDDEDLGQGVRSDISYETCVRLPSVMNCLVSRMGQLALLAVTVRPLLLGSMLQNAFFYCMACLSFKSMPCDACSSVPRCIRAI